MNLIGNNKKEKEKHEYNQINELRLYIYSFT